MVDGLKLRYAASGFRLVGAFRAGAARPIFFIGMSVIPEPAGTIPGKEKQYAYGVKGRTSRRTASGHGREEGRETFVDD